MNEGSDFVYTNKGYDSRPLEWFNFRDPVPMSPASYGWRRGVVALVFLLWIGVILWSVMR